MSSNDTQQAASALSRHSHHQISGYGPHNSKAPGGGAAHGGLQRDNSTREADPSGRIFR